MIQLPNSMGCRDLVQTLGGLRLLVERVGLLVAQDMLLQLFLMVVSLVNPADVQSLKTKGDSDEHREEAE